MSSPEEATNTEAVFTNPLQADVVQPLLDSFDTRIEEVNEQMPSAVNVLKRGERQDAKNDVVNLEAAKAKATEDYVTEVSLRKHDPEVIQKMAFVDRILSGDIATRTYNDQQDSETEHRKLAGSREHPPQIRLEIETALKKGEAVSVTVLNSAIPTGEASSVGTRHETQPFGLEDMSMLGLIGAQEIEQRLYQDQSTETVNGVEVTSTGASTDSLSNYHLRALADKLGIRQLHAEVRISKAEQDATVTVLLRPE